MPDPTARAGDPRPEVDVQPQNLSVGDALTVLVLVAFIFGWMFLCFGGDTDAAYDDLSGITAALLAATILGPPMWAGKLISHIVRHS